MSWRNRENLHLDIQKIKTYLQQEYGNEKTIEELAPNNHINCKETAFDYDEMKRQVVKDQCDSADALYITKWFNFIEFKTGFAKHKNGDNERTHKENLKLRIRLKAYESIALFEKVILPKGGFEENEINGKRRFVAVIDAKEAPLEGMTDILAELSDCKDAVPNYKKDLHKWLSDSLLYYRKEFDGKHIFYDDTQVWYDYEVNQKINRI